MVRRILLIIGLLVCILVLGNIRYSLAQATVTPTPFMPQGASWQGYVLIEIAPVGPFVDGVSDVQKARLHEAFLMISRGHDSWPPYALQDSRWRLDNLALIVEARFISMPSKAQVVQLIANRTGYTVAQVNNVLTFTVFAYGGTWAESRAACIEFLALHENEWEAPIQ